jgi:glycogen synthase
MRVLYSAGPGDVLGTFRKWSDGDQDATEVSLTYSGQFFDFIKSKNWKAVVIASHPPLEKLEDGDFLIEHWVRSSQGKQGLWYHVHELQYCGRLVWKALAKRVSMVVLSDMQHWWAFSVLRVFGIKVVPTLHCTFWPAGRRPTGRKDRIIQFLNSWFWRKVVSATICISPECKRQVELLTDNRARGPMYVGLAQFVKGHFDQIPAASSERRPFILMYAGRVEENKGVFDLIKVMERLREKNLEDIRLEVCGGGNAEQQLRQKVEESNLSDEVRILGRLNRDEMLATYSRCHAVIVPTTSEFSEGLNKVVVEGVLAHRPTICTSICPAKELLGEAIIEIAPGDIGGFVNAIEQLYYSDELYGKMVAASDSAAEKFYDSQYGWGQALQSALDYCVNG